jgi:hypothetical protein
VDVKSANLQSGCGSMLEVDWSYDNLVIDAKRTFLSRFEMSRMRQLSIGTCEDMEGIRIGSDGGAAVLHQQSICGVLPRCMKSASDADAARADARSCSRERCSRFRETAANVIHLL